MNQNNTDSEKTVEVKLTADEAFHIVYALTKGRKKLRQEGKDDLADKYHELAERVGASIGDDS